MTPSRVAHTDIDSPAFSDIHSTLGTLAYTQLIRLAPRVGSRRSGIGLSFVLRVLTRLGASSDVLEKHQWSAFAERSSTIYLGASQREEMCYRLASLVDAYAE